MNQGNQSHEWTLRYIICGGCSHDREMRTRCHRHSDQGIRGIRLSAPRLCDVVHPFTLACQGIPGQWSYHANHRYQKTRAYPRYRWETMPFSTYIYHSTECMVWRIESSMKWSSPTWLRASSPTWLRTSKTRKKHTSENREFL